MIRETDRVVSGKALLVDELCLRQGGFAGLVLDVIINENTGVVCDGLRLEGLVLGSS